MDRCQILGVVQRDGPTSILQYLNEHVPASPEVLAMSAPLKPTEVFRLAATCAENKCPHFDGRDCRLATRIVQILPGDYHRQLRSIAAHPRGFGIAGSRRHYRHIKHKCWLRSPARTAAK